MDSLRVRFAAWVIEKAIKIMPEQYRSRRFVDNLMRTGHI